MPGFIDHVTLTVRDYDASKRFYRAALGPWEAHEVDLGDSSAFGPEGNEDFVITPGELSGPPVHIAFNAPNRATVNAFHWAGLAAGGRDNGPPGLRRQYHPGYYAAYLLDPDSNNVEAVFHDIQAA